eukprot:CAMPEP_0197457440 /NCGR_PEP_ID=MMETSP1175-20131217/46043_1 /TAXON_ID=1003142 /ORGANISM="Triceratium dubium, Strain CCMP147" /LENGTH=48 /DNA_ID= /DNA_START= /DNA_END= /DNA_ORIENTATION=
MKVARKATTILLLIASATAAVDAEVTKEVDNKKQCYLLTMTGLTDGEA